MENLLSRLDRVEELHCDDEIQIIEAFMERYEVSRTEAEEIFNETKKWLWLASKNDDTEEILFIDRPLVIIDEMWHNFILHTRQYYNFCIKNFKKLVHHNPTPVQEKRKLEKQMVNNPISIIKEHEEKVKKQYSLIYDNLGPETLLKWYDSMAQKYTPEYIQSIKKS